MRSRIHLVQHGHTLTTKPNGLVIMTLLLASGVRKTGWRVDFHNFYWPRSCEKYYKSGQSRPCKESKTIKEFFLKKDPSHLSRTSQCSGHRPATSEWCMLLQLDGGRRNDLHLGWTKTKKSHLFSSKNPYFICFSEDQSILTILECEFASILTK